MSYDAYKTRSPDDEYDRLRGRGPWCEGCDVRYGSSEYNDRWLCAKCYSEAEHQNWLAETHTECLWWQARWALLSGRAYCRVCKRDMGWTTLTVPERWRHALIDLRWWWRWTFVAGVKRATKAVGHWRRGHRPAPWKPDDEVPF